jgi:hypothetical protein
VFVVPREEEALTKLRKYRNYLAHAKIDKLAAGVPSGLQTIGLAASTQPDDLGIEESKPGLRFDDEVWAHLSAESSAEEIFLEVREVMFDIFDRALWNPTDSDDQF